jgi:hypothetical protein
VPFPSYDLLPRSALAWPGLAVYHLAHCIVKLQEKMGKKHIPKLWLWDQLFTPLKNLLLSSSSYKFPTIPPTRSHADECHNKQNCEDHKFGHFKNYGRRWFG